MLDKLNYGDIVTVEDYPTEYWRINGFQENTLYTENEPTITEHWIDLECPWTGAYNMAFFDEITVVALRDEADAFLADKPEPATYQGSGINVEIVFVDEECEVIPLTQKATPEVGPTKQERIDALLDERIAVSDIAFTDEESRAARYAEIDAEIAREVAK